LPLRKDLEAIRARYPQQTYVYFAYLNNSSWIGLGERDRFYAASTTKVPLAMTILKAIEDKKLVLDQEYSLDELDLSSDFGTLYQKGPDATFSIRELLDIMLKQSDDTASVALLHILNKLGIASPLDDVYNSMGWEFNTIGTTPDYKDITLKTLSNMFISLYNASYVSIDNSQLILDDLTKTPFDDQIVAGLPAGVRVAHKIGIADQYQVYSDCGIVYIPDRNYLLCLASQGVSQKNADAFMKEVSATVFSYVNSN
jgi:beta-lactamase class A